MPSRNIAFLVLVSIWLLYACQPSAESTSEFKSESSGIQTSSTPISTIITQDFPVSSTPERSTSTQFTSTPLTLVKTPSSTLSPTAQTTPKPTYDPESWTELPVIPVLDERVKEIYLTGTALGNRPNAFSKVGDCGSTPSWFLGDFDRGPRFYNLGEYSYLQAVIDYYQGSFGRTSLAALAGYNTSSVLTPLWSNKEICANDESPLACEYRVHRPAIALITLGANDVYHLESFEPQLRKIIEFSIEQGVIPVLATKPDNLEKDHSINKTTAKLAYEYRIPLWNYWKAVQDLPNHGLQEDGVHITFAGNDFSNPLNMQAGWPVRNLTALQILYTLYTYLNSP